jgi:tetratricopeptide (TPR) repeat protein
MVGLKRLWIAVFALAVTLTLARSTDGQTSSSVVSHRIDGRVHVGNSPGTNMRVRLLKQDEMRPITETFSRSRGEFEFTGILEGEYLVETFETPELEATTTTVSVRPLLKGRPEVFRVEIEIPLKVRPGNMPPGVIMADVDLHVPKQALKHYRDGMTAMEVGNSERGIGEFQHAIQIYPEYYAARLELGRELRLRERFKEAEETLRPLEQIAPKRAEARIEYAIVLLKLQRHEEAATVLRGALKLGETNWAAHFYLGWALLETHADDAEHHFQRALELDEREAARAHLALARLADAKGLRQLAIKHLEAYLALLPNASDVEAVRKLAERLRQ